MSGGGDSSRAKAYNPHIVLLQAPTHQPSSSLDSQQRLYFPIDSPPTPAPSPRPQLPYAGLPAPFLAPSSSSSLPPISNQLLTTFTSCSSSPQTRRQILTALLQACTPNELLFLSQTIAPLLKRDFLFSLPPELGLHVLGFIDDPKALIRASLVSKWWYRMVRDESVWRRMCLVHGFGEGDREGRERERNKHHQHQHRHKGKHSMANLKEPSRGEVPFSALLREDNSEGLSGLSSPPTDSSSSTRVKAFSYRRHFKISHIIRLNWRHGGKLLNSQIITPVIPPSRPLIAAAPEANNNPDDALPSTVTSFALDRSWLVVGLANSSIKVFSAHSGVLARTLVGHESGVWGVCLVGKGGWREGVKEEDEESGSNERREVKVKQPRKKKRREKERQAQETEDTDTTPKQPTARESASASAMVSVVVDPDSGKTRRRRDTDKGKVGEKEERRSRRTTEAPVIGHIRVEASDRVGDEPSRGSSLSSSSSSHPEGQRAGASSAPTTSAPGSAGTTTKPRKASTRPTTPKKLPRKYPPPQNLHDLQNEFEDLSILQAVESGLAGETFPILSAGTIASASASASASGFATAPASAPAAAITDESEAHSRSRHDTHHHHHHHHRRSRRNSTANPSGTSTTNTAAARNADLGHRRAPEHVDAHPHPNAHQHQRGTMPTTSTPTPTPTSVPKGDGMHVMPGESLAHLLPSTWRVALGLRPVVVSGASDSEGSSDDDDEEEDEEDEEVVEDGEEVVGGSGKAKARYRRRRWDSHGHGHKKGGEGDEREHDRKTPPSPSSSGGGNMTNASPGWGQPNALVVSGGCDKVLRVWDVKSGQCIYVLHGHTATIRAIRILPNRPIAITGSRDATLRIWDVQRGLSLRVLEGHASSVRCLDVAGNRVVSGSYDSTCRVWDIDTGECVHVLRGHFHQIYSVVFDGVRVVSGGLDTSVRVWDAETGQCIALLQGHAALVCQLQLSRDLLVTGGSDGRVITFSLETYKPLHRIAAHDSSVTSLQFDTGDTSLSGNGNGNGGGRGGGSGEFLVTAGNDGRVKLWELATGRWVRDLTDVSASVWKVGCVWAQGCVAVMCRRDGKTVVEVWSMRPRAKGKEREVGGREKEKEVARVR